MSERYPELGEQQINELKTLGLRFAQPPKARSASDAASAINLDSAKDVVGEFRATNYEPEGYTLSSYASVQAFAAAANGTGGTDGAKMADWLRKKIRGAYFAVSGIGMLIGLPMFWLALTTPLPLGWRTTLFRLPPPCPPARTKSQRPMTA